MGDLILFCPCQLSWSLGWKISWRPVVAVVSLLASSFRYACILLLFVRITLKNVVLHVPSVVVVHPPLFVLSSSKFFCKLSETWLVYQDQVICSCIFVCLSGHFSENNRVLSDDILSTGRPSYLQCMLYVESEFFPVCLTWWTDFFFFLKALAESESSKGRGREVIKHISNALLSLPEWFCIKRWPELKNHHGLCQQNGIKRKKK